MKNKLFLLLKLPVCYMVLLLIFTGCVSYKHYSHSEKVGSDPVTVTLKVVNNTDQDFTVNCTWCVDKKDQTHTVKAGTSYTLQSNTHDASGTVFTVNPKPPLSIDQPNPSEGTFQMTYGYWNGAAHVVCDDECNNSNPTEKTHYEGCNWVFDAKFEGGKGTNATVTFTTKSYSN
jgi:hypothetical protein